MPGKLFLVVADTTNLIAGLREERLFLQRLVGARARPPISNLFDRSFGSRLHYLFSERRTMLALNLAQIFALALSTVDLLHIAMRAIVSSDGNTRPRLTAKESSTPSTWR